MINPAIHSAAARYRTEFVNARPFPHVVIDGFFEETSAEQLLHDFPRFDPANAITEHGEVGRKATIADIRRISPFYTEVYRYISSPQFLDTVSEITGIPALVHDELMFGGGTHENLEGHETDVHVDFNFLEDRKLHRRLNLLLYLNKEWDQSWGGCLELHTNPRRPKEDRMKLIVPLFNRCVIFETSEHSWHGFERIRLPDNKKHLSRKLLSIYLYTRDRPAEQIVPPHSTFYVQRPLFGVDLEQVKRNCRHEAKTLIEFVAVTVLALGLYLPFLSIRYDPNGLIEAMGVENGPLLNKNHMLYRPVGLLAWRALHLAGYSGNSLPVLQAINALAGALGVGLAFLAFRGLSSNRTAALMGAAFLGTSFTYWVSATDVLYITIAGMFAVAGLACVAHAESARSMVAAGVLAALSIFTWQGSLFLVPALVFVFPKHLRTIRCAAVLVCSAGLLTGAVYIVVAFKSLGFIGPRTLWTWFTHYSENATLPIWGVWQPQRVPIAALSALDSVTAVRLAAGFRELFRHVQLGRVAVDCSVLAFGALMILAFAKARLNALFLIAAYLCFVPFIVWWDPASDKWFLIPNIFLAAFLVRGLAPWLQHKYWTIGIMGCLLIIAGTNFITTIRPRHFDRGQDRRIAECVAGHMRSLDLFVAAEWGWADYLPYVHGRAAINIINEFARFQNRERTLDGVHAAINETHRESGNVYMADPRSHADTHLQWLEETTGMTFKDLSGLGGTASFMCYGVTINQID
jgi:2OG-Fe(II) oxygenase superfamily